MANALNKVNSGGIEDGSIVNADVKSDAAIAFSKLQDVSATDRILGRDSANAGDIEEITPANVRTMLNVEDGADVTDASNVDAAGAVMNSDVDAKGDIFAGTADNTVSRLASSGTNDDVLTVDTSTTTGLKWAAASGGAALSGSTNNTVVTVTGADAIAGEANLTFDGAHLTIADGNLVIGTSGHGIDFSATSDGSGTDSSELLDDYEEGTFTPYYHLGSSPGAVTDSAKYQQQDGRYTKIGRFVSATFSLQANNSTSNFDNWSSGDGFIKGWPYPFMGSQPTNYAFCRYHSMTANWGTTYAPFLTYENYSDKAMLQGYNSGGVEPPGNVGNHFGTWGSLQYHTT